MKTKLFFGKIAAVFIGLVAPVFFAANSFAIDTTSIKSKAAFEGLYQCAKGGAFYGYWNASSGGNGWLRAKLSEDIVKLPYGLTDASDNNANCFQLIQGFNDNAKNNDRLNQGLVPATIRNSSENSTIKNFFAGNNGDGVGGMGYTAEGLDNIDTGQTTEQLRYTISPDTTCVDSNGFLVAANIKQKIGGSGTYSELIFPRITNNNSDTWFSDDTTFDTTGINVPAPGSGLTYAYETCGTTFQITDGSNLPRLTYTIYSSDPYDATIPHTYSVGSNDGRYYFSGTFRTYNPGNASQQAIFAGAVTTSTVSSGDVSEFQDYRLNWQNNWMKPVVGANEKNTIGYHVDGITSDSYGSIALTDQEIYDLYKYYITSVYGIPVVCEGEENYELYASSPTISWKKGATCRAFTNYPQKKNPTNVYGVDSSRHFTASVNLDDIIATLASINLDTLTDADTGGTIGSTTLGDGSVPDASDGADADDPCYNAGIEAMSWILCPTINNLTQATNAFEDLINNSLSIDSGLYDNTSYSREVWGYFRDIANVIMIIILIAIIFSQVTGFGIDNYGIKKMLPRLVIMAVFINLSFLICQLLIDFSNILGVGLERMFRSIGEQAAGEGSFHDFIPAIVTGILAIAAGGGLAAGGITTAVAVFSGGGAMMIISLVLTLLGAFVSVFIFFLTLGARLIIVIVFSALAPIAIACYVLPNTQAIFKQWWKVFRAALVVYPICGALYGFSFIIRAMVLQDGSNAGFLMKMVAILAPFLPFFVLPALLRSALNAIGQVGGALTQVGRGLRFGFHTSDHRVRQSEAYKSAQERLRRNTTRRAAGVDQNGNRVRMSVFRRFISGGDRGVAQARARYVKDLETAGAENELLNGSRFDSALANVSAKTAAQRVADQAAWIESGKAEYSSGGKKVKVNANDMDTVAAYHAEAIQRYQAATNQRDRDDAMAQIKAAQNIMGKQDNGRRAIQRNFEDVIRSGNVQGINEAAGHVMDNFGDKFKSVNRGAHKFIADLATKDLEKGEPAQVAQNLQSIAGQLDAISGFDSNNNPIVTQYGAYSMAGTDKYTAESLVGADDEALDRLVGAVQKNQLPTASLDNIQRTAYEALEKKRSGTLNIKPEVETKLNNILGANGGRVYSPASSPNRGRPHIVSEGLYTPNHGGGTVYLRGMSDGKFYDASGRVVNIKRYKKQ